MSQEERAEAPWWVGAMVVVLGLVAMALMWIKVSEKPMLESEWFIGGFPGVYAVVVIVLSLVNGVVNAVRSGWFYPAVSRRLFAWSGFYTVLAPFVLATTGGSMHQIQDMDPDGSAPGMLVSLALFGLLGAIVGQLISWMYLQPISIIAACCAGRTRYSQLQKRFEWPPSRAAAVPRSILVMAVPIFAIGLVATLGDWEPRTHGFTAQSGESILHWMLSGDISPISIATWVLLAVIIVCAVLASRAYSSASAED